jgi:hypothetical protein
MVDTDHYRICFESLLDLFYFLVSDFALKVRDPLLIVIKDIVSYLQLSVLAIISFEMPICFYLPDHSR